MRGPMWASSSATNSPVFLFKAMKLGELGEGIFTCVQSWPLEVQAKTLPVVHFARGEFGDDQLPEEHAGLFVEAKQDAAVALVLWIARVLIVRADEDLAAGDDDVAVGLRAEAGHPLHIFGGRHVDL